MEQTKSAIAASAAVGGGPVDKVNIRDRGCLRRQTGVEKTYLHKKKQPTKADCFFGGDSRSRTDDPLLAKQML